jgi:hypothetical protein
MIRGFEVSQNTFSSGRILPQDLLSPVPRIKKFSSPMVPRADFGIVMLTLGSWVSLKEYEIRFCADSGLLRPDRKMTRC